jgi:hypothetical protein
VKTVFIGLTSVLSQTPTPGYLSKAAKWPQSVFLSSLIHLIYLTIVRAEKQLEKWGFEEFGVLAGDGRG